MNTIKKEQPISDGIIPLGIAKMRVRERERKEKRERNKRIDNLIKEARKLVKDNQ